MRAKLTVQEALKQHVLLFDGAMGTELQKLNPQIADFGAPHLEGCNELLSLTRPDWIKKIHYTYLEAGAQIIETNSFGANAREQVFGKIAQNRSQKRRCVT